ncbi:MAG: hypothetical protein JF616_11690 [Fibrobacteres bacterium]|nr:hypothetical protein [Fibrobacterota bacterium]
MFRLLRSARPALLLGAALLAESSPAATKPPVDGAIELSFTKGDTHNGTRIRLRILGDSIFYHRTLYAPGAAPRESEQALLLDIQRQRTLQGVMGELPRYPAFGSCYGEGMRYYLVETDKGKFYRSVPEQTGKCYLDEPSIFSLFEDLDDLLAPPGDLKDNAAS